jgi:LmbE family N-acetylglucosaminyl deacetylase
MMHKLHWLTSLPEQPMPLLSLNLPKALRLVTVGPHPDDFDAMGVTMRFFHERGDAIRAVVCHTSSGVQDSFCSPPTLEVKQALREQEQRDSLRFFGLPETSVVFLDLCRDPSDNDQPFDCVDNQARLGQAILSFEPDLVFFPHGNDTNSGHRRIYAMVTRLLSASGRPVAAWLVRDPKTTSFRTDIFLAFDEAVASWKAELLRFHRSQHQRNLNTRGHGFDERILNVNRQLARELGLTEPYAEAFELKLFQGRIVCA